MRIEGNGCVEEVVGRIVLTTLRLADCLEEEAVIHLLQTVGQLRHGHTGLRLLLGGTGGQEKEKKEETENCFSHD